MNTQKNLLKDIHDCGSQRRGLHCISALHSDLCGDHVVSGSTVSYCWLIQPKPSHSFPWGFEVETYCETKLASFQVQNCDLLAENATWLLIADGLSPQIHGPCLTPWQHEMNLTPRGLWNTKNILETFPVLDTTHMNTWKLGVTIATPWATAS